MEIEDKGIVYRIYIVAFLIIVLAIGIVVKLTDIQWVKGDHYRELAKERTVKNFVIPANKGNVYSADGSLLATSIPSYNIRFDAMAPKKADFKKYVKLLSDSLSILFGKPSTYYYYELSKARVHENRYYLVARNLSYSEYMRVKKFPLFKLGSSKGGMIIEQRTIREHPIGKIAERTIGYERVDEEGKRTRVGIEGAFGMFINGKSGQIVKQRIAKNQWKPISDENQIEPQDGYDIVSTIDVYIQDIAHHSLLEQLKVHEADHGCVVVMETQTGKVKAISNLGRASDGSYYETVNYAVAEAQEPGSTFKLVGLIALLEDKAVDTSTVFDTYNGEKIYYDRTVRDSREGGYGKISLARSIEVSSNTVIAQAVYNEYKKNPKKFIDHINHLGLDKPLGLPFRGEGIPKIPRPGTSEWSGVTLPWMAYGYGLAVTPLQILTLYNAIANGGEMVKPIFVTEVKEWDKVIKTFDREVISPKICSEETVLKIRALLKNVIKNGSGKKLYSKDFSMAGKTGTAQVNYGKGKGANSGMYYASSFAGYFPAETPKYSCIVVIHSPKNGYYGVDVSGPVFKRIAQKIFTDVPFTKEIEELNKNVAHQDENYDTYLRQVKIKHKKIPNVYGMPGMDAVALLENLGLKVQVQGIGKVTKQSIEVGETIYENTTIILELS